MLELDPLDKLLLLLKILILTTTPPIHRKSAQSVSSVKIRDSDNYPRANTKTS